jgi:hypothetical protein
MKTYAYLWQYLPESVLEREMFQKKVVEKLKHIFYVQYIFFQKSCRLWDSVEKYGTARQATQDNIMLHRNNALCTTDDRQE